ncbi:MAG: ABC transporter permease, partial [Candidatus Izimaplasma sp.]|nr:ABC transporter permease [Candidatus Izimaplasma bacterium]
YKLRYVGVIVSGALAGIGGVIFVLSFSTSFNATVAGFGFLALAVLIFGNWNPKRIIMAALFFGFMRVISSTKSVIPVLNNLGLDDEIYLMLPYVATLIVLAFVSKNSAAPRAAGEPYDPGKR